MTNPLTKPTTNPTQAASELQRVRRERARRQLIGFTKHTYPDYQVTWFNQFLAHKLDSFVNGEIKRLMVFMPPGHGKSELVSRRLPCYILGRDPDARIIATSHTHSLASDFNRDCQKIISSDEYAELFPETTLSGKNIRTVANNTFLRNSEIFEVVGHRGRYVAAGVGGAITGKRFDYGLVDDPIKSAQESHSKTVRDSTWAWFSKDFMTRIAGQHARVLITLTRWHHDDIAGRLLELARHNKQSAQWEVVIFPAIKENNHNPNDPRTIGEALWPAVFPLETLAEQRAPDPRGFEALYQQNPTPTEGDMFKRQWFEIVGSAPSQAKRIRWWDKAGSQDSGAYTAGVLVAYHDGVFYIEDVIRGRWSSYNREVIMRQTAELDSVSVTVMMEQEPGSGGKESAEASIRNLAGFTVRAKTSSGDKAGRAEPLASQAEAGNVKLVRGDWNADFLDEITTFPYGKFKDQVDAAASAFVELAATKPRPTLQVRVTPSYQPKVNY